MNNYERLLSDILLSCIRGSKTREICCDDFKNIYEIAKFHQVHTLLYPSLKNIKVEQESDNKLISSYKKEIMLMTIFQNMQIKKIREVVKNLHEAKIPVIILKGLVLRELYPHPDMRTMCDADILVHKEHMEQVKNILAENGYFEEDKSPVNIKFCHREYLPIEVHVSLINHTYFKSGKVFEKNVWKNVVPYNDANMTAFALSLEDHLLYLFLHMAIHIVYSGFGLRQLCDVVLLIEAKRNLIDWKLFSSKAKDCDIETFIFAILGICNELFRLKLPIEININTKEYIRYKELLINEIFESGVYGHTSRVRKYGNKLRNYLYTITSKPFPFNLARILRIVFPPMKKMSSRYEYVKKYPFLIPVSWLHRIIFIVTLNNDKSQDNSRFFQMISTEAKRKAELLQWLGLQ